MQGGDDVGDGKKDGAGGEQGGAAEAADGEAELDMRD